MTATARKLALLVYRLLTYNRPYEQTSAAEYDERQHTRILRGLRKRATSLGFELVEASTGLVGEGASFSGVSYRFTPNVAPGSVPAMNVSRIAPATPGSVTAPVIGSTEVKTMLAGGTNRSAVSRPSM